MKRKMTQVAGLGLLLLASVALGDSLPAGCPGTCGLSDLKAYYTCPDHANHGFLVWPAWRNTAYWPPACDWHCEHCLAYPSLNDSIICVTPSCGWEWHRP